MTSVPLFILYRRGSWRPIGHMRPSSPLLDSVRDTFEGFEQLARDFGRAFQNNRHLCDVIFNVGQGKYETVNKKFDSQKRKFTRLNGR